jgi:hypothetical protein
LCLVDAGIERKRTAVQAQRPLLFAIRSDCHRSHYFPYPPFFYFFFFFFILLSRHPSPYIIFDDALLVAAEQNGLRIVPFADVRQQKTERYGEVSARKDREVPVGFFVPLVNPPPTSPTFVEGSRNSSSSSFSSADTDLLFYWLW